MSMLNFVRTKLRFCKTKPTFSDPQCSNNLGALWAR
jgi:hypothetical protein